MRALIIVIFFVITIVFPQLKYAITMESFRYGLELESSSYSPSEVLSTTTQYSKNSSKAEIIDEPLFFSISNAQIIFNDLYRGMPITKAIELKVLTTQSTAYQIQLIEERTNSLEIMGFGTGNIECTTYCSSNTAGEWKDNKIYGIGYRMVGLNAPKDFINSNYYRPFNQTEAVTIVKAIAQKNQAKSILFIKANIPQQYAKPSYHSVIHLMIIPEF